jgi:signal peptide peptidase SppA
LNYPYLASRLFNTPLMIHPGKLHAIVAGLSDRFGVVAPPAAYATPTGMREKGGYRIQNGVAVLDIFGVLAHRGGMQGDSSYIQGYDGLARQLDGALRDPAVEAILLNIDSPGGEVAGAFQLADQIHAARSIKPIHAIAGDLAASAAYLIASAADSLSLTATGIVGSIGVVTSHVDMSRAVDRMGMTVTYIYAGAHKIDGNPLEPLPEAVAAQIQAEVDYYYQMFLSAVAAYRPATDAAATESRLYIGKNAVDARLADRIETPDQAIARLANQISVSTRAPRAKGASMNFFNFGKKRLNLDISVSEPDPESEPEIVADLEDRIPDPSPAEPETAPPAAAIAPPAPAALSAMAIVQACNAAGESRLAELVLQTPHTAEQLRTRIDQAKSVRAVCATAGLPDLADGLIAHGADESAAKLATWEALAARTEKTPIDATQPVAKQRINRAEFESLSPVKRRDFVQSGGQITE